MKLDWVETADAETYLATLPAGSIHCCVTSPPYFGQRDYMTGQWEGGDGGCDHIFLKRWNSFQKSNYGSVVYQPKEKCPRCGAIRKDDHQLGVGESVEQYVDRLRRVFSLVRRALRKDGTLWLNIDTSYRDKRLILVPALTALALQQDGWILRSEIIWHKTNAMPSSVTDRPTKAHETIYMFSRSTSYYYDWKATTVTGKDGRERRLRSVWNVPTRGLYGLHFATYPLELIRPIILSACPKGGIVLDPFMGSGTTAAAAARLGRHYIGCELNPEYAELANMRGQGRLREYLDRKQGKPYTLPLFE